MTLTLVAFAVRLAFYIGDPQPFEQAGSVLGQGLVARNIVDRGKWGVISGDALVGELQAERQQLVNPSEVDFTPSDLKGDERPLVIHPQGPALLLAALWTITGQKDYIYLQLLQVVLGSFSVLLIYWICMRLYARRRAALLGAALYAVFPPIAHLMRVPLHDAWAVLLTPVIFAAVLQAATASNKWRWTILTGLLVGIGLQFREGTALIPPFVALALLLAGCLRWRRAISLAVVPSLVALVFVIPWTIRNAHEFHSFVPIHTGFGQVLWEYLGERPNAFGAVLDDGRTFAMVHSIRPDLTYGTPDYDDYLRQRAFRAIVQQPGFYATLVAGRVVMSTVGETSIGWMGPAVRAWHRRNGPISSFVTANPIDSLLIVLTAALGPLIFLTALISMRMTWHRYKGAHAALLAVFLAWALIPILLGWAWRYVAPASFVWMLAAALGADLFIDKVRISGARHNSPHSRGG